VPPREHPGESLWTLQRDGRQVACALRDHGEAAGAEVQLLKDGEFYAGRRFETRAMALRHADHLRESRRARSPRDNLKSCGSAMCCDGQKNSRPTLPLRLKGKLDEPICVVLCPFGFEATSRPIDKGHVGVAFCCIRARLGVNPLSAAEWRALYDQRLRSCRRASMSLPPTASRWPQPFSSPW
jgi:hypothetical protein